MTAVTFEETELWEAHRPGHRTSFKRSRSSRSAGRL